jgi:hypothetical protein
MRLDVPYCTKLRMRARNVGEISAGQVDDLQATTTNKSAGRKPAGKRRPDVIC